MRAAFARVSLCLFAAVLVVGAAVAGNSATPGPAWGKRGMVVTSVGPAADAGREILGKGGNAVDAAIATAFAAGVAHQYSSGLGGGAFAVVFMAESGEAAALDARETAPAGASTANYLGPDGKAIPDASRIGPRAIAVPSLVQGLWELHQRYGSLEWKELVKPAIRLCRDGIEVGPAHQRMLQIIAPKLANYPETARIQLDGGKIPALGWRLRQPDLAKTLEEVGERGGDALAKGHLARAIVDASGGALTLDDLAGYRVIWRTPVRGHYRGLDVVSMPPPSSGGVLLLEMLNVLEHFDLAGLEHNSAEYIRIVAEAMKRATVDKDRHLGDPKFVDVPLDRLTGKDYAAGLASEIRGRRKAEVPRFSRGGVKGDTTHVSVIDADGSCVTMTHSLGMPSGVITPGLGFMYNGCMGVFDPRPGRVGSLAPGKSRFSSVVPSIVFEGDRPHIVIGAPGATQIAMGVLQVLLNAIDFEMTMVEAVSAARFSATSNMIDVSNRIPRAVQRELEQEGYEVVRSPTTYGFAAVHAIRVHPDGLDGGADPGHDGVVMVV